MMPAIVYTRSAIVYTRSAIVNNHNSLSCRMDAMLVPRTDIVTHFRDSGLAFKTCGNPYKIVGASVSPAVKQVCVPAS